MSNTTLNLYVSPAGNDQWSGLWPLPTPDGSDGPLATVAAARNALRSRRANGKAAGPVRVQIAEGRYELPETLAFTPVDSGTVEAPVRYVAAPGANPVLSGGRRIGGWQEVQHGPLRCWVVELPEVATGRWRFSRLYVNDTARQRPRLPRAGFYRFTGVAGYADPGTGWGNGPDRANFAPGDIQRWHNWEDVELITYQLWFDTHHRLKAIDESSQTVHFHTKSLASLMDERNEFARYFVENVFEALDTPGQWYLDRPAGRLYYLPLPEERIETAVVIAPKLTELVRLEGAEGRRVGHLHFENLTFAHQHWELPPHSPGYIQAASGVPGAILLKGAEACVFYGCTIAHINSYGLEVKAGSTANLMAACTIHDAGGGGIKIGHEQIDRCDTTTADEGRLEGDVPAMATTVVDCIIRDCGLIFPSAIGIWIGNSGWNRILHNHILNCNYTGISCGWTWGHSPNRTVCNRIENNHIHHINNLQILSDNGGIYTLGEQPGSTIVGNVLHDIACYGYGGWGIYPDEGSSEMRIEHNLVYGTQKASFMIHCGWENLVQHNLFALSQEEHICLGNREAHRSVVFRHNIVVTANGRFGRCHLDWDPAFYTVEDNLYWTQDGSPLAFNNQSLACLQERGINAGAVVADPLLVDAAGGDFTLRSDSPAYLVGFRPYLWRTAGVRPKGERPLDYPEYVRRYPLPGLDQPVVRTKIELSIPVEQALDSRCAEFRVTISNVGRIAGQGALRLSAGPKGAVGSPSLRRIAYQLAPGETQVAQVSVKVRRGTREFWLDSEAADNRTVPARGLVLDPAMGQWTVPRVSPVTSAELVAKALARVPARDIRLNKRVLATITLGTSDEALLFHARFFEPQFQPNWVQPWKGTALELISYQTPLRQLFLVPRVDEGGLEVLRVIPGGREKAPEIRRVCQSIPGGCEIAALIPWNELALSGAPGSFPFAVMVDAYDPGSANFVQVAALEVPAQGSSRPPSQLVVE
jgi:hypothetical protein